MIRFIKRLLFPMRPRYKQRVQIVSGFYAGYTGTIEYHVVFGEYRVTLDGVHEFHKSQIINRRHMEPLTPTPGTPGEE